MSRLQGNLSSAKKPASFVSNTPTVSFTGSDAARKNDVVEDESAKKTKSVTSSKSATRQPVDLNLEAEKVPSKTKKPYRSTGAEQTSSNTPFKTPKAPGSDTSKTRSMSRPGSKLTPSKPSFEVPTNNTENMAGEDATKKDAKATMKTKSLEKTMKTTDKSLEKPPKTTKPGPAVETAKADVKKKPAAASSKQ